jgi:hypothetical protein
MSLLPDERYGKILLYAVIFDNFFVGRMGFDPFARLVNAARFLLNEKDGRLYELAYEIFYLIEETEDNPEVLAEINKNPVKGTPYLSLDEAMPQLRMHYDEICELHRPYLP